MIDFRLRATVLLLVGIGVTMARGVEAQCAPPPETTGIVAGAVFLEEPGESLYVPGAEVLGQSDTMVLFSVTDQEGKFRLSNMEPGTYIVEATYFGLHAEQKITVEAGDLVQVGLPLTLTRSNTSAKP